MTVYEHKIEEKVKAMRSEIKLYREPTVTGRKPGLNGVDQKEERNIQPE